MLERQSLTNYSRRIEPKHCADPVNRWHRALNGLETKFRGNGSFNPDFHNIPCCHCRSRIPRTH